MQNYCKTIGALAAASALVAGNAQAEVEYELHAGYSSEYIFRGVDQGDQLVETGVNMATEYQGFGFSAGAWYGTFDAPSDFAGVGSVTADELDLFAEVNRDFGFATLSVGYIAYIYPQSDVTKFFKTQDDTQEVTFGISRDFGFLTASYVYYLIAGSGDNGGYMQLDLSRSFEINQCLALNVDTNFGYLGDEGSFSAWTSRVSLDWGFAGTAKFSPFIAFSVDLTDSDVPANSFVPDGNEVAGGAMISVSF
jgi:uncharacterized protein (TIGR02001 family)